MENPNCPYGGLCPHLDKLSDKLDRIEANQKTAINGIYIAIIAGLFSIIPVVILC